MYTILLGHRRHRRSRRARATRRLRGLGRPSISHTPHLLILVKPSPTQQEVVAVIMCRDAEHTRSPVHHPTLSLSCLSTQIGFPASTLTTTSP